MYAVRIPLSSTDLTVGHEVYINTIYKLMTYLNIDIVQYNIDNNDEDTSVRYKNKKGTVVSDSTPRTSFLKVTSSEEIDDEGSVSLNYLNPDQKPFYNDTELNSKFNTIYQHKKLVLTIQYHVKSRSAITSVINRLKTMSSHDGMYNNVDIKYYYVVPKFLLELLIEINTLKNTQRATLVEIDQYVTETFDTRADMLNAKDGNNQHQQLVIRETQQDILTYITTPLHNIKYEKDDELGTYYIEFDYVTEYDAPIQAVAYYPSMVYNVKINEKFRKFIEQKSSNQTGVWTAGNQALMDVVNKKTIDAVMLGGDKYYVTYPTIDKFKLPKPKPKMVRLMSLLIKVDPLNPTNLLNLNEIPNLVFHDEILNLFMNSEYPYVGELYRSIFYFELFKGDAVDSGNIVLMDNLLNLTTTNPMDMKFSYRVVINALVDLSFINTIDIRRIENYTAEQDILNENTNNIPFFQRYAEIFTLHDIDQTLNGVETMKFLIKRNMINWQNYYTLMTYYATAGLFKI